MKRLFAASYFVVVLLCGCNLSNDKKTGDFGHNPNIIDSSMKDINIDKSGELVTIKLPGDFEDLDAFTINHVVDSVWFVPLETKKESLIRYVEHVVSYNGNLYVLDIFGKSLLVFDSKGKFKSRVGREGKGPGEYLGPKYFIIDEEREEILVYDNRGRKIIIYNLKGELLREERTHYRFDQFEKLQDGSFAVTTGTNQNGHLKEVENSKLVLADSDWTVHGRAFSYNAKTERALKFLRKCLIKHRNGLIFNPTFSYSVYGIYNFRITEKYYIDAGTMTLPSDFNENTSFEDFANKFDSKDSHYTYIRYPIIETDHHLITVLSHQNEMVYFFYSKKSGRLICSTEYLKSDFGRDFVGFVPAAGYLGNNILYGIVHPETIIQSRKKYKENNLNVLLPKAVWSMAESIQEGDNPILAFYTLKSF